jgi:membrane protease YdiL (CAAX protease family)
MKNWIVRHETATFLVLTFGLSWPLWFASGTLGRQVIRAPDLSWLLAQVGVFAPAFAGMIVAALLEPGMGRRALRSLAFVYLPATLLGLAMATRGYESFTDLGTGWTLVLGLFSAWILVWFGRTSNRHAAWPGARAKSSTVALWTAGATLIPPAAFVLTWLMLPSGAASVAASPPPGIVRDFTVAGVMGAVVVNLPYGGSLGEEPGWRGVWLPRLLRAGSPLYASFLIGVFWSLWHAPIDLAQGFGTSGIGALMVRMIWTLPMTVLFTWVTVRAGGSLLPPIAFHTSLNALPDFLLRDPKRYEGACAVIMLFSIGAAIAVAFRQRSFTGAAARQEPTGP